jgi:hypothetical protein
VDGDGDDDDDDGPNSNYSDDKGGYLAESESVRRRTEQGEDFEQRTLMMMRVSQVKMDYCPNLIRHHHHTYYCPSQQPHFPHFHPVHS